MHLNSMGFIKPSTLYLCCSYLAPSLFTLTSSFPLTANPQKHPPELVHGLRRCFWQASFRRFSIVTVVNGIWPAGMLKVKALTPRVDTMVGRKWQKKHALNVKKQMLCGCFQLFRAGIREEWRDNVKKKIKFTLELYYFWVLSRSEMNAGSEKSSLLQY